MWCKSQFQQFNDKIKLDVSRRGRIDSAITRFEEFARNDDELHVASKGSIFLQGSVATQTVIKPIADDEFDVDVIYPFDLAAFPNGTTPSQIVQWFLSRLSKSDFYRSKLIAKDRCARIDYARDFHIDIIPATSSVPEHRPYAVPAKDVGSWITNDPNGFTTWVAKIDARSNGLDSDGVGRFVRCCRYAKRWRDSVFGAESAPSSILLVTMLGRHDPSVTGYNPPLQSPLYPTYQYDVAYLYDMLRLTHSCIGLSKRSAFIHPTLGEDLSVGWADRHLPNFMAKLATCIDKLGSAIRNDTESASISFYREALGSSFPGA